MNNREDGMRLKIIRLPLLIGANCRQEKRSPLEEEYSLDRADC